MRILHFSPHDEDCGIAKYQEHYIEALASTDNTSNVFFEYSPYQTRDMDDASFNGVITNLQSKLGNFDVLHIQHEFGFFRNKQLQDIVDTAKRAGKKVVVTYHTSPDLIIIKKPLAGLGPRNIIGYARSRRHNNKLIKIHITPLLQADSVVVHNKYTLDKLVEFGVTSEKITLIPHPTYEITSPSKTSRISDSLNKKSGDILLSTIGYIHRFKGIDKAIKALNYLPDNYKLAVLGGVKSDSDDQKIYDSLADLVVKRGLKDRVFISGVIPNDDDLNSYVRETDVSLYPYDSRYYKGVGSGALNLAIANERPIVAYPVSTLVETNDMYGHIMFTDSDSYYEMAREILRLDIKSQSNKITKYAKANSFKEASHKLISLYKSL